MARSIDSVRELSPRLALMISGVGMGVIAFLTFLGCGLMFQPGWANGWPGVSKHSAFAGVMSTFVFIILCSGAAAIGAPLCAFLGRESNRRFAGWPLFLVLMLVSSALAAWVAWSVYPAVRASIAEEWH